MKKYFLTAVATFFALSNTVTAANYGGFQGPGLSVTTAAEAAKMADDTPVVLVGQIERSLGDEKYLFKDSSGSIVVEIDDDDWRGITVTPENTVELRGEVDKEVFRDAIVDVDSISLK